MSAVKVTGCCLVRLSALYVRSRRDLSRPTSVISPLMRGERDRVVECSVEFCLEARSAALQLKRFHLGRPKCSISPLSNISTASRSVIHLTRLETRTKESNMCASHSVLNRLERRNESKQQCELRSSSPNGRGAVTTHLFCLSPV